MTPVAHEIPYYRASRAAHRAWLATQPQHVIPGLLDELDSTEVERAASPDAAAASVVSSPPGPGPSRCMQGEGGLDTPPRKGSH